jgi:hypothetical protein
MEFVAVVRNATIIIVVTVNKAKTLRYEWWEMERFLFCRPNNGLSTLI